MVISSGCTENIKSENNKSKYIYGNATIENIDIKILRSFPVQVNVTANGFLADSCTSFDKIIKEKKENIFFVTITTVRPSDLNCEKEPYFFEKEIPLDTNGLDGGVYIVSVNGVNGSFEINADNNVSK